MINNQPSPPRFAQALLRALLRPTDTESIPGDLLEEYCEVRRPLLGRIRADAWYVKHVLSILWRVIGAGVIAIIALRIFSFPLPGGWNPSLVPAPGVSLLDALILLWAGYHGAQRTGRIGSGLVTSVATSLCGFTIFVVYVSVATPTLLLVPIEKPFIFVITLALLVIDVGFGIAVGLLGAVMGRYFSPVIKTRLT